MVVQALNEQGGSVEHTRLTLRRSPELPIVTKMNAGLEFNFHSLWKFLSVVLCVCVVSRRRPMRWAVRLPRESLHCPCLNICDPEYFLYLHDSLGPMKGEVKRQKEKRVQPLHSQPHEGQISNRFWGPEYYFSVSPRGRLLWAISGFFGVFLWFSRFPRIHPTSILHSSQFHLIYHFQYSKKYGWLPQVTICLTCCRWVIILYLQFGLEHLVLTLNRL